MTFLLDFHIWTPTLFKITNDIADIYIFVSLFVVLLLLNLANFAVATVRCETNAKLAFNAETNNSFSAWYFSLWPLIRKAAKICIMAHFWYDAVNWSRFPDPRDPPQRFTPSKHFSKVFAAFYNSSFHVCAALFAIAIYFVVWAVRKWNGCMHASTLTPRQRTLQSMRNFFVLFCEVLGFAYFLALFGALLYVAYVRCFQAADSWGAGIEAFLRPFHVKFSHWNFLGIVNGVWRIFFLFEGWAVDIWKSNVTMAMMLPMVFVMYRPTFGAFVWKELKDSELRFNATYNFFHLLRTDVPIAWLADWARCVFIFAYPLCVICAVESVLEEYEHCKQALIIPRIAVAPKNHTVERRKSRRISRRSSIVAASTGENDKEAADKQESTPEDDHVHTSPNSERRIEFWGLLIFVGLVTFLMPFNFICAVIGELILFEIIAKCRTAVRMQAEKESDAVKKAIYAKNQSLYEDEVVHVYKEVIEYLNSIVEEYVTLSLLLCYIGFLVFPTYYYRTHFKIILFYVLAACSVVAVWSYGIWIQRRLKSYLVPSVTANLLAIFLATLIVGFGGWKRLLLHLTSIWIFWNIYTRFVEKK